MIIEPTHQNKGFKDVSKIISKEKKNTRGNAERLNLIKSKVSLDLSLSSSLPKCFSKIFSFHQNQ